MRIYETIYKQTLIYGSMVHEGQIKNYIKMKFLRKITRKTKKYRIRNKNIEDDLEQILLVSKPEK